MRISTWARDTALCQPHPWWREWRRSLSSLHYSESFTITRRYSLWWNNNVAKSAVCIHYDYRYSASFTIRRRHSSKWKDHLTESAVRVHWWNNAPFPALQYLIKAQGVVTLNSIINKLHLQGSYLFWSEPGEGADMWLRWRSLHEQKILTCWPGGLKKYGAVSLLSSQKNP